MLQKAGAQPTPQSDPHAVSTVKLLHHCRNDRRAPCSHHRVQRIPYHPHTILLHPISTSGRQDKAVRADGTETF